MVVGRGGADFEVLTLCLLPLNCQKSASALSQLRLVAAQGRERAVWGAATSRTYQVSMPRGWRALVARISRFSLCVFYDCPITQPEHSGFACMT